MFRYLIIIRPLGFLYGSAGAFLSPENLVGRSGEKFPPGAATLSGLFFNANWDKKEVKKELKEKLYTAGPFWAKSKYEQDFYVPIPWHRIIAGEKIQEIDEWVLDNNREWQRQKKYQENEDKLEPAFKWQTITSWGNRQPKCENPPWKFTSILHPQMKENERHTLPKDGLFLENAVQMEEDFCLVYLSTHKLPNGWYKFGGENHIVEIESKEINEKIIKLLQSEIKQAFALITPGVWGSTRFSHRFPQHPDFKEAKLLTEKAVPYRYSAGGRLRRGRYAVPSGSVYVLKKPINLPWFRFPDEYFPNEGYSLQHVGCGLCLPIEIQGLSNY
ncbi:MAG: CRISPR-associated protein [Nostoc sp. GBBB01]|nr:CRISPR-associated protein [Nostoc sp. GBBB01]